MSEENEKQSLSAKYFADVYDAKDDPWDFATSEYERKKYEATVAALPGEKYASAFEIGCSIGVLTARLATRCSELLAIDVSEKALRQAREKCAGLAHVRFEKITIPDEFPAQNFDLIVVSEVGYYLNDQDWRRAFEKIVFHLEPRGNVVLVHWTHFVEDYPQTGDAVHDSFAKWSAGKLKNLRSERTDDYRLEVWEKL